MAFKTVFKDKNTIALDDASFTNFRRRPEAPDINPNTNFSGDPTHDRYRDSRRKCNIVVPEENVPELIEAGITVKSTTMPDHCKDPDNWKPTYFVRAIIRYNSRQDPDIYLVTGLGKNKKRTRMDETNVHMLDDIAIDKVKCVLNIWKHRDDDGCSLFVNVMYCYQHVTYDPFASEFEDAEEEIEAFEDDPEDCGEAFLTE